jgi:hypothetical protein
MKERASKQGLGMTGQMSGRNEAISRRKEAEEISEEVGFLPLIFRSLFIPRQMLTSSSSGGLGLKD